MLVLVLVGGARGGGGVVDGEEELSALNGTITAKVGCSKDDKEIKNNLSVTHIHVIRQKYM